MITEFYLVNRSFQYQEGIEKEDLIQKLENLSEDYLYIRKYKDTDKIYVHPSIYKETIYPNITVKEFLYMPKWKKLFDRDTQQYLRIIIDRSKQTDITVEEVIEELLEEHSEEHIFGLLCLHEIQDINPQYLVYNKNNWLQFHRHFLKLYPIDVSHFYKECIKYFPDLFFHSRVENTISRIFSNFTSKIIFHLAALNDEFNNYKLDPYQRIETLKAFSIGCNLDQEASTEGNAARKLDFTFDFPTDNEETIAVCCEPHLKLCYSDEHPGDAKFYFHRIYFHEGQENIAEGKILIGHIGTHL